MERAFLDDGGYKEIAEFGVVNDVAENLKLLAVFVYLSVEFCIICGRDGEKGLGEVVF